MSELKEEKEIQAKVEYSIIVPVYNEEDSLKPLLSEILQIMPPLQKRFEIIFVNDCSVDNSANIAEEFTAHFKEAVRVITLEERGGQTQAMRIGLKAARGTFAITMDADLQNDPADIPKLLEKMQEGYDCVCGWRKARQDTLLKAGLSKFGNILQRFLTGVKVHDVSCTLRMYRRDIVPYVTLNWEGQHRFIPLSLTLQGYKVGEIVSHHRKRQYGYSKYTHKRIFRVIIDFFRILKAKGK